MLTRVYAVYLCGDTHPIAIFPVLPLTHCPTKADRKDAKWMAKRDAKRFVKALPPWTARTSIEKKWADLSHCIR